MADRSPPRDARLIAAILRVGLVLSLVAMVVGAAVAARNLPLEAARMTPFEMSRAQRARLERDRRISLTAVVVVSVLVLGALLGRG